LRNEIQENATVKKKWSFWKGVGLMFKVLGVIVIVALLFPIGYFAWRAGQPMSMQ
jgi:predicted negative regulator of RcsB-dependent stress response